jgi:membrane-associated phospholipid phosphatase
MKIRTNFFVAGLFFLLVFAGYSRVVKQEKFKNIDFAATVKLQERIDKSSRLRLASFVGNVMEGSTFFASPVFTSIAVGLLTLIALFGIRKKSAQDGSTSAREIKFAALIIPVLFGLLVLGEIYGKSVVHHPSPPFFMIKNPTSIFPKDYINEQFSYPSGHTARAVFLSIVCIFLAVRYTAIVKKRTGLLGLLAIGVIYVNIVAVARIYLGHHWLSDIIGGGLLGGGLGILTFLAL